VNNTLYDKDSQPHGADLTRPMGVTVELVRVVAVNTRLGYVDCQADSDPRLLRRIPLLSLYEHPDGTGLFVMPRPGALAVLMHFDRGTPRLLAFRNEWLGPAGYLGRRRPMAPGDVLCQTHSGAFFLVRNQGIIEAVSTPDLSWSMTPAANRYRLRAENIELAAIGGGWHWRHYRQDGPDDAPASRVVLRQEITDRSTQPHKLETTHGWHRDGALYRQHYEEPDLIEDERTGLPIVNPLAPPRQATHVLGDLDRTDHDQDKGRVRQVVNLDDGMYRQSIGQTGRGVVRTHITNRPKTVKNPAWSLDQVLGPEGAALVQTMLKSNKAVLTQLTIDREGLFTLAFNDGQTELTIDAAGQVRLYCNNQSANRTILTVDNEGAVHLDCHEDTALTIDRAGAVRLDCHQQDEDARTVLTIDTEGQTRLDCHEDTVLTIDQAGQVTLDCNKEAERTLLTIDQAGETRLATKTCNVIADKLYLGSEDDQAQPAVLGNKWKEWHTAFMTHTHISNLGAPTGPVGPVTTPHTQKADAALSTNVFVKPN